MQSFEATASILLDESSRMSHAWLETRILIRDSSFTVVLDLQYHHIKC